MNVHQRVAGDERFVRRYDDGEEWTIAADLRVPDETVDVDVVGRTAILVVDAGDGLVETEIELPSEDATVGINNGVVVFRGTR